MKISILQRDDKRYHVVFGDEAAGSQPFKLLPNALYFINFLHGGSVDLARLVSFDNREQEYFNIERTIERQRQ